MRVPALESQPIYPQYLTPVFSALVDLTGERAIGSMLGPIPWRAIRTWAREYGVHDLETFIELVQHADAHWLRLTNAHSEPIAGDNRADAKKLGQHGSAN